MPVYVRRGNTMKRNLLFISIISLFFFTGCSLTSQNECFAQEEPSDEHSSAGTLDVSTNWIAPYTQYKFQQVLDRSKLQCPNSDTYAENGVELRNASSRYFHMVNTNKMEFYQTGDHNRTELRDIIEWKTSTPTNRWISARIKVQAVSPDLKEVTVLQIHDSGTVPNKPLVRIAWLKSKNGLSNHIWSIRRTSVSLDNYSYTDLGAPENQFFKINVSIVSNKLTITYNGEVKVNNAGIYYWRNLNNYFKAGAYLQSAGYAYIRFDALEFH